MSGACPPFVARPVGNLCNNGSNVCDADGNCVGSYCLQFPGLSECQCTEDDGHSQDRFCDVCCLYQGACQTTFDLAVSACSVVLRSDTLHDASSYGVGWLTLTTSREAAFDLYIVCVVFSVLYSTWTLPCCSSNTAVK